jgi:porin
MGGHRTGRHAVFERALRPYGGADQHHGRRRQPHCRIIYWAVYWNGFQYLQGDEKRGWGLFGRFGFSDGDPNPIAWSMAAGLGGVGLLPARDKDRWGVGLYHLQYTDKGVIEALGIDDETGGEVFYNIEFTPWMHVTLDAQIADSAIPGVDTAFVLGTRVVVSF